MSVSAAIVGNQLTITGAGSGNPIQADHLSQNAVSNGRSFADSQTPGEVVVNTGKGTDLVEIFPTELPVTNIGNDSPSARSTSNTLGTILPRGESGENSITINEQGNTTKHTYTHSWGELRRSGAAPAATGLGPAKTVGIRKLPSSTGHPTDADNGDTNSLATDWRDGTEPTCRLPIASPPA